jgi:hypothetical protein
MDVDYLKSEFLNFKSFLYKLYVGNPRQNASVITQSTDEKLNVLIKILHLICVGKIHLRKVDHETIKKSKRLNYLKLNFNTKNSFINLLKSPREEKIVVLRKFSAIYQPLLFTMFNLI